MGTVNTSAIDIFIEPEPIKGCFHYTGQRSLIVIISDLHIKVPTLSPLSVWPLSRASEIKSFLKGNFKLTVYLHFCFMKSPSESTVYQVVS